MRYLGPMHEDLTLLEDLTMLEHSRLGASCVGQGGIGWGPARVWGLSGWGFGLLRLFWRVKPVEPQILLT